MMDCKCFFLTIFKVLRSDGVVEGIENPETAKETEKVRELIEQ
jgi:hypothetical protein